MRGGDGVEVADDFSPVMRRDTLLWIVLIAVMAVLLSLFTPIPIWVSFVAYVSIRLLTLAGERFFNRGSGLELQH